MEFINIFFYNLSYILKNFSLFSQYPEGRVNNRDAVRDHADRRTPSYADLVKWQGTPIRMPLLRLPNDLAPLALECFECILRYCDDIPHDPELTEVKCVYTVLMVC